MADLNELAAALAQAQAEIEPAPRDSANPYFKSKYASLPAVREAMRGAFAKHGLSVVQMPEVIDGQLRLRTLLLHSSGQSLDCGSLAANVDLENPQKIGSAITYFRRYALAAISQTVADEDDDANAASQKAKLSKRDQSYVAEVLKLIADAKNLEELQTVGEMLRDKSPAVQSALRGGYMERQRQLKDQENAASDS